MYKQCKKIYEYMKEHKSITQREAIMLGCYRLAPRIFEMREEGILISKKMIKVENADKTTSFVCQYSLEE